jgi:hypothetical protein
MALSHGGFVDMLGESGQQRVKNLWRLLAYLGRYAHQPVSVTRRMTMSELHLLAEATNGIVEEENTPAKDSQRFD